MSTRQREPEQSGLLKYAPERALASAPELAPSSDRPGEPRSGGARPPERRPPPVPRTREPAPPRKVSKQKGSLEGDVAIEGVCERITRAPDLPPAPPMGDDGGWVFGIIGRLAGCVAMAAVAAYGFVRISAPRQPADNGFAHAGYAPATDAQPDTEPALDRARIHAARPADGSFRPAALRFSPLPAAGVEADTLRPRNEPTPLNRPLLLAAVPSPTLDPSRDLADGSREGPTSGIAVPSISPVLANPASLQRLPLSEVEIQTAPRVSSAPRTAVGEIALSSCEAAAISPRNLVTGSRDWARRGAVHDTSPGEISAARVR